MGLPLRLRRRGLKGALLLLLLLGGVLYGLARFLPIPPSHLEVSSSFSASEGHFPSKKEFTYAAQHLHPWEPRPPVRASSSGGPGEGGSGVIIPPELTERKKELFKINQFNLMASDRIALNRSLQDVRLASCREKVYPPRLPSTSIIIVFHNEASSTLLRTLHSIINRSPPSLLEEIILVDDASSQEHLGPTLETALSSLPARTSLIRSPSRSGLIRARLLGASHATGSVLTFLDAHVECTEGWLEPMLAEIASNRAAVVCPIIDVISDETFEYIPASDLTWGGFNWKLNFRWYRVPAREMDRRGGDRSLPVKSPAMAGGLFSIDKEYFYEIGAYDEGMDIWGGENLEMSFRVWQCGGTLLIVPCSHVGHVFRDKSPYTFPGGVAKIVNKNAARVAEVWMDEWRDFYYSMNPGARNVDLGDIRDRQSLRKRLQCKSFRWYLETVYPESQMPLDYYYLGEIKNLGSHSCLDTMGRKSGQKLGSGYCHGLGGNQIFSYTKRQQIMSDDNCLDASGSGEAVKLVRCHGMGGNQAWNYSLEDKSIRHMSSNLCLSTSSGSGDSHSGGGSPILEPCTGGTSNAQVWIMNTKYVWQAGSNGGGGRPEGDSLKDSRRRKKRRRRKKK